jgi:TolA-binding protein
MDYAPRHLDLLVMAGEKARGMAFYQECITSGDLKASPAALFKIGSWFNEKGQAQTAVQALNTLVKNHPQDALIPKTCYRAAQILHEKLMNTEKAKKLLTALIAKYPDHEISGFARSYLDRI